MGIINIFKKLDDLTKTKPTTVNNDNYKEDNEYLREIIGEERYKKQKKKDELNKKYKDVNDRTFAITEYLQNNKTYSKAINSSSISNSYTEEYIKLMEEYLTLIPKKVMYEKERIELDGFGENNHCNIFLKQYILLLDKLENYERESEIIGFLIGLGLTDDDTKGGLLERQKKVSIKLKQSRTYDKFYQNKK